MALILVCCVSYRIHSIYLLRLFNDPIAMLFFYASVNALLYKKYSLGCSLFSVAVSIKMNILLVAPGLLLVLLLKCGILGAVEHIAECGIIQLILGAPFLFRNAPAYLGAAFNFGRQFMYKWTVNWKIFSEPFFLDRRFHALLLILHLCFLSGYMCKFIRSHGGFSYFLKFNKATEREDSSVSLLYPMFVANFVGIVFSRSLHYQFYVWYYHTVPYILWGLTDYSNSIRFLIFGLIELAWNVYPSTWWSSAILHLSHAAILLGLFRASVPMVTAPAVSRKGRKLKNR